jgi:hypothetical protein
MKHDESDLSSADLQFEHLQRLIQLDSARQDEWKRGSVEKERRLNLETENKELRRRLDQVLSSRTWRTGSRVRRMARPFHSKGQIELASAPKAGTLKQRPAAAAPGEHRSPIASQYELELQAGPVNGRIDFSFAVSTTSLDEGRGDILLAVGVGRYLRRLGFASVYVPTNLWTDGPSDTTVIALLPTFDPEHAPTGSRKVAWIRNEVDIWLDDSDLAGFDAILCSSEAALTAVRTRYSGPALLLPIGVDLELFQNVSSSRKGVVSTVNQWGVERDVYAALRSSPINFPLRILGQRVNMASELTPLAEGPIDFFSLPDIYGGSRIVLDDFNRTTVGWGAVNSRVFEAIASGAVPVTNSGLGLEVLGLGEVPVYENLNELNDLVANLLADPEGLEALAGRLREPVEARHSLATRAAELTNSLSSVQLLDRGGR